MVHRNLQNDKSIWLVREMVTTLRTGSRLCCSVPVRCPVVNWRSELISVATKCGTCQILRGICPSSITAAATLGRTTQIDSIKYFWKRKIFLPRLARRLGLHVGWGGARRHGTQQMRCLGGNQNTIWHSRTPGSVNVLHRFKSSC